MASTPPGPAAGTPVTSPAPAVPTATPPERPYGRYIAVALLAAALLLAVFFAGRQSDAGPAIVAQEYRATPTEVSTPVTAMPTQAPAGVNGDGGIGSGE